MHPLASFGKKYWNMFLYCAIYILGFNIKNWVHENTKFLLCAVMHHHSSPGHTTSILLDMALLRARDIWDTRWNIWNLFSCWNAWYRVKGTFIPSSLKHMFTWFWHICSQIATLQDTFVLTWNHCANKLTYSNI